MTFSAETTLTRRFSPPPRGRRSTPAGEHRPVLLADVLAALDPKPGQVVVDCTTGWAGHAAELLSRVGTAGRLVAFDLDPDNLPRARERLDAIGNPFTIHPGNFAGLQSALAGEGIPAVDALLADLGMSSMQVDDAERGFSYVRDGPLDMRMDRSRGRTAAQLLATVPEDDLRRALQDLGDEPQAALVARGIVRARESAPIERTADLARVVREAVEGDAERPWQLHPKPGQWVLHPAARTFQALRILVNRELANLEHLLRVLPAVLKPGGRAAIISFHSGEDRLVKAAFRDGLAAGAYAKVSPEPIRATFEERNANPRARSAKLRWAVRASD
jgi:16S rRNA (cytosine1402-N4)-methyltransferase